MNLEEKLASAFGAHEANQAKNYGKHAAWKEQQGANGKAWGAAPHGKQKKGAWMEGQDVAWKEVQDSDWKEDLDGTWKEDQAWEASFPAGKDVAWKEGWASWEEVSPPVKQQSKKAARKEAQAADGYGSWEEPPKADREGQLQEQLRQFVVHHGGSVDGPRLAAEIASQYNQWVRPNSGRNDGSFRKWVGATPGVWVEKCGQNKWRVHSE